MLETDGSNSVDFMAQDAAQSLLLESQEIAEHILHEHENDGMLGKQQGRKGGKQSSSSSGNSQGSTFKLKLPSFAAGGNSSDSRTQQQQSGRADRGKYEAGSRSSGSRDGSASSQQGRGSRGASPAGGSSGDRDDSSGSGPRRLSNDNALGRVAEARGGVPLVVLKQGKARLFEMGSPMVSPAQDVLCTDDPAAHPGLARVAHTSDSQNEGCSVLSHHSCLLGMACSSSSSKGSPAALEHARQLL
jgi:hypothetical protein